MALLRLLMFALALVLCANGAEARTGTTTTDLALRAAPSANTELLLTMPAGSKVSVGGCARGWCKVNWNSYSGYASQSGLAISAASRQASRGVVNDPGEIWPIYPPYPYRSGYYPKADWYHDMPPYVAMDPSFHRRRYFMMAQERNRYRYMPHIFHGYSDGDRIDDVDIRGLSENLDATYR
jgi:hypothetical protein